MTKFQIKGEEAHMMRTIEADSIEAAVAKYYFDASGTWTVSRMFAGENYFSCTMESNGNVYTAEITEVA